MSTCRQILAHPCYFFYFALLWPAFFLFFFCFLVPLIKRKISLQIQRVSSISVLHVCLLVIFLNLFFGLLINQYFIKVYYTVRTMVMGKTKLKQLTKRKEKELILLLTDMSTSPIEYRSTHCYSPKNKK